MPITKDEFKEKYPDKYYGGGEFDKYVDAVKADEATEINNGGWKKQVKFLLERIGPEMLDRMVGD